MIHSLLQTNSIYGKLKLTVYISKTKIDVVSKGRQSKYVFTYNGLLVKLLTILIILSIFLNLFIFRFSVIIC